jgi:CubicO group peptidase (beta-lactamase class C family)
MFLTAGYLVETMTGKSWEESVRSLVFAPLGMTRSNFSVVASQKDADFAQPYAEREGKITKIPFRDITLIGPAGSINSSVNEMSRWVSVHINGGKLGDAQVIGAATLADLHTPYMTTGGVSTRPDITAPDYALGWMVDTTAQARPSRRQHRRLLAGRFCRTTAGFVVLTNKKDGLPSSRPAAGPHPRPRGHRLDRRRRRGSRGRGDREEGRGEEDDAPAAGTTPGHKLGIRGRILSSR